MIDEADRAAIVIMAHAAEDLATLHENYDFEHYVAIKILHHAIRHLAYPDRDIYPKVRGSRKGYPVVRRVDFFNYLR